MQLPGTSCLFVRITLTGLVALFFLARNSVWSDRGSSLDFSIVRRQYFSGERWAMNHLDLVKLTAVMELTNGRPEITVGLLDGPVSVNHPDLAGEHIREIPGSLSGAC